MSSNEATASSSCGRNDENAEQSEKKSGAQMGHDSSQVRPPPLNSNRKMPHGAKEATSAVSAKRRRGEASGDNPSAPAAKKNSRCVDFSVESLLRRPLAEWQSTNQHQTSPSWIPTYDTPSTGTHLTQTPPTSIQHPPPPTPFLFGQLNLMQYALQARNWWRVTTSPLSQSSSRPLVTLPSPSLSHPISLTLKEDTVSSFAAPYSAIPFSSLSSSSSSDASTSATTNGTSCSSSDTPASSSSSFSFNSTRSSLGKDQRKQPQCEICGKTFGRCWLLKGHVRTHTGEKPYECDKCGRAFADKSNLRAHVQTHSSVKPFSCPRCGRRFALRSYLAKHEDSSCGGGGGSGEDSNWNQS